MRSFMAFANKARFGFWRRQRHDHHYGIGSRCLPFSIEQVVGCANYSGAGVKVRSIRACDAVSRSRKPALLLTPAVMAGEEVLVGRPAGRVARSVIDLYKSEEKRNRSSKTALKRRRITFGSRCSPPAVTGFGRGPLSKPLRTGSVLVADKLRCSHPTL